MKSDSRFLRACRTKRGPIPRISDNRWDVVDPISDRSKGLPALRTVAQREHSAPPNYQGKLIPDSFVGVQRRRRVENHLFGVHSRETQSAVYSCSRTLASYPPTALLATSRVIRLIRELNSSRLSRELPSSPRKLFEVKISMTGVSPSGPRTAARSSVLGRNIFAVQSFEEYRRQPSERVRKPPSSVRRYSPCLRELGFSAAVIVGGWLSRLLSADGGPRNSIDSRPDPTFGELGKRIALGIMLSG